MPFYIFVNGNRVHDEGEHDAKMRVTREGGGDLSFATKADAQKAADAMYAAALERYGVMPRARRVGPAPDRANYFVGTAAPDVVEPTPVEPPPQVAVAAPHRYRRRVSKRTVSGTGEPGT